MPTVRRYSLYLSVPPKKRRSLVFGGGGDLPSSGPPVEIEDYIPVRPDAWAEGFWSILSCSFTPMWELACFSMVTRSLILSWAKDG